MRKICLFFFLCILLLSLPFSACGGSQELNRAQVTEVIDGDTVWIKFPGGETDKVRYIGMDTPEIGGPVECYGREAENYNRSLVGDRTVWLEYDVEQRDRYGRILAYVYLDPNADAMVNAILVAQGYAQIATYPPNVRYADLFLELQETAREHGLGLWCECKDVCKVEQDSEEADEELAEGESPVEITCIHFDAPGNDGKRENKNGEWVALKALEDVDMSGWTLKDEVDHTFTFPGGFSMTKGETARVYTGFEDEPVPATGCGENPDYELFWGFTKSAVWNNGGDVGYLEDESGELVAECGYKGRGREKVCS